MSEIFISYSHQDKVWLEKLRTMLAPFSQDKTITFWDDSKIKAGTKWMPEITDALQRARVAVLLVSPTFLASNFIRENELPPILKKAESEGLTILWVAVSTSIYEPTPISEYQAAHDPSIPLDRLSLADVNSELKKICLKIVDAAKNARPRPLPEPVKTTAIAVSPSNVSNKRVALLYKRNGVDDERVMKLLNVGLTQRGYEVFIDQNLRIGVRWAQEIEKQINESDVVIPLISAASVHSEMFAMEVSIAHEAAEAAGKPRILPVRVNFTEELPSELQGILGPLQYAFWGGPQEDEALVAKISQSIEAPEQTMIEPELIGGAIPLESKYYITRDTDKEFKDAIIKRTSVILIKGARQMGKTSLLARGLQVAREENIKVIQTDFQKLSTAQLASPESFFLALAANIARSLKIREDFSSSWNSMFGPNTNFEYFWQDFVFPKFSEPIIWGLDVVDRLFSCDFGSEVFGLFRSWHNERALDPESPWKQLTLAISYATEAHLFITDPNMSPFNVGKKIELKDLNQAEVAELNNLYATPLKSEIEIEKLMNLLGGHPYLTHRALQDGRIRQGVESFGVIAARDDGPYGDHLRRIVFLLARDPQLCEIVRTLLRQEGVPDEQRFYRLRNAGVLTGETAKQARPRCGLYETYLKEHLL